MQILILKVAQDLQKLILDLEHCFSVKFLSTLRQDVPENRGKLVGRIKRLVLLVDDPTSSIVFLAEAADCESKLSRRSLLVLGSAPIDL